MKKIIFIFLSLTFLQACGRSKDPDFPPDYSEYVVNEQWSRPQDCKAQIKEALCVVSDNDRGNINRPCVGGEEKYLPLFESLYDNYPPELQKMFCSIRKLYIETSFYATAYASSYRNPSGELQGAAVGVRKTILDSKILAGHWNTWKEQLSFGGVNDTNYQIRPDLPTYLIDEAPHLYTFIYFVMAHEMGHLFDFANNLSRFVESSSQHKTPAPRSWGELSWINSQTPFPEQDYEGRDQLCFYSCQRSIEKSLVPQLYAGLYRSNFISTYASTNPWDDFAEALAFYITDKYLGINISLDTRQGEVYDSMEKLHSPMFTRKFHYLESFLADPEIKYP